MNQYPKERKESVLLKLLNPGGRSIAQLAKEEGISEQTLYAWRNQARASGANMPNNASPSRWDKQTKFAVVVETAGLNAEELSAYCREKGLYPKQVSQWREACMSGIESSGKPKVTREELRGLKSDKKALERELRRKDKALAESAALLVLAKKYRPLWEDEA